MNLHPSLRIVLIETVHGSTERRTETTIGERRWTSEAIVRLQRGEIGGLVAQHALTSEEAATQTALLTTWLDSQFNEGSPTPNQP